MLLIVLVPLFLTSCKPSQESLEEHAEVTTKLREYEQDAFFKENYNDTVMTDYLHLSYEEYRKKYDLKHRDMDYVAQTSQLSCSILETNRKIEKFSSLRDSIRTVKRIDTTLLDRYSFNKIMPIVIDPSDSSIHFITSDTLNINEVQSDSLSSRLQRVMEDYEKSDSLRHEK